MCSKEPQVTKQNYARWSERLTKQDFMCPYSSVEMMGNIYVYLLDDEKPICFWTGPATDFINMNPA